MTVDETRNWFADDALAQDPYPFLAELRSQCPVQPTPHHNVIAVTGYAEVAEILRQHDTFSACNTVVGPFANFPEPLAGDDVSELIERYGTGCHSMTTWSPWTSRSTPGSGRCSCGC